MKNFIPLIFILVGSLINVAHSQCTVFIENFNNSLGQFTPQNGSNGNWIFTNSCGQSNSPGHSAPGSALFEGSSCQFGNGGSTVSGEMVSPSITLPGGAPIASFKYYINNECGTGGNTCWYDALYFEISNNGGVSYTTIASSDNGPLVNGGWHSYQYNLSSYAGQTIIIRFRFNSKDGWGNAYDGIYVDDVLVIQGFAPTPTITAQGPIVFCPGDSVILSSTPASKYQWSNGDTTQSIVVTSSGSYSVMIFDGNGCPSESSNVINVTVLSAAPAPLIANDTICYGDSTALVIGNSGIFEWYDSPGGNLIFTGDSMMFNGTTTTTYYIQNADTGGFGPGVYYLTSQNNEPWWDNSNIDAMDQAFGPGNWTTLYYQNVNINTYLNSSTCFIYVEGSDCNDVLMEQFLINNLPALEAWVNSGGHLFLNSAPNCLSSNMNLGFGNTTLNYPYSWPGDVISPNPNHPVFAGPFNTILPMSGGSYAHATISGTSLDTILVDQWNPNDVVLAEKTWGNGKVMFGAMTNHNFHWPAPEVGNFRANVLTYMSECGFACVSQLTPVTVVVNSLPVVSYTANPNLICISSSVVQLTGGTPSGGVYTGNGVLFGGGNYYFASNIVGFGTHPVVYTYTDNNGCVNSDTSYITVYDCVGINELSAENISVFPNPANNELNIQFGHMVSNTKIEILSYNGQLVYSTFANNTNAVQLDLSKFNNGLYLLRLSSDNGEVNMKIMKQ